MPVATPTTNTSTLSSRNSTMSVKNNPIASTTNDGTYNAYYAPRTPSPTSKRRKPSKSTIPVFAIFLIISVIVLGSVQLLLNTLMYNALKEQEKPSESQQQQESKEAHQGSLSPAQQKLQLQVANLQAQVNRMQQLSQVYSDDGNFYPFSIRDSRRLVPTQMPPEMHVFDYVDITSQNQQKTRKASLFLDSHHQGPAPCQEYNRECYKKKIIQVFELVLELFPNTEYFFYMEADNELCVPMTEVRRYAYQYERYFITTGIGFSGWIMQRQFMYDFLGALKAFKPPKRNTSDILDMKGDHPDEGPDPIAADMLVEKQGWTVTRQYLVSHTIQGGQGADALTVRMPNERPAEVDANGKPKKKKDLDKHLPRCLEPRRSKWRVSKKDHRDRFGWDYFDYDECDGEVFPCYVGQLEELLERDMKQFNYTQLDIDRAKLIKKQQQRERAKLQKQEKDKAVQGDGAGKEETPKDNVIALDGPLKAGLRAIADHQPGKGLSLGTKEWGGQSQPHFLRQGGIVGSGGKVAR
eukprot:Nitzschia sp. Nitz4//scaffold282_size24342//5170//6738//NITZ4_008352-RA/size24342-processed-gene-0.32-mRNA-1//-1//CDS//3329545620//2114//frame0